MLSATISSSAILSLGVKRHGNVFGRLQFASQLPTDLALTQNNEHTLRENLYTSSGRVHSQDQA